MAVKPLSAEDAAALAQRRKQPERAEQRAIVQLLRSIGASVYVLGTTRRKGDHPGTMQTPGLPDLYAVLPRNKKGWPTTPLWIEVKSEKGRLKPPQVQFIRECAEADIRHITGTCDAVQSWLTDRGWLKG